MLGQCPGAPDSELLSQHTKLSGVVGFCLSQTGHLCFTPGDFLDKRKEDGSRRVELWGKGQPETGELPPKEPTCYKSGLYSPVVKLNLGGSCPFCTSLFRPEP